MTRNQQNGAVGNALVPVLLGTFCSFSLFAAYMVVPPAGLVSGLLAPFPACFSRLRYGRTVSIVITFGTAALLAVVFGPQTALVYLVQCAVTALVLPELLVRKWGAARSLLWTVAVNMTLYGVAAVVITLTSGHNVHQLVVKEVHQSVAQAVTLYEQSGLKGEELALMKRTMETAAGLVVQVYPALLTLMLLVLGGCNLALLKRSAPRYGFDLTIGSLREYRNPEPLIWLLIVSGFAMLIPNLMVRVPALNLLLVLVVLYFLQGWGVLSTFIARQTYAGLLRTGLILTLIFQPYLTVLVTVVGIFDLWGDFRAPRKENL